MIAIGLAFILFWVLITIFHIGITVAAVVTGVAFVAVGLLLGERSIK